MSISYSKSKVISSTDDAVWPVMNLEGGVAGNLEVLEYCKYLGVEMSPSPVAVSSKKGDVMISCLNKFKGVCQWFTRLGPDKTTLSLAVWNSRAMGSLLFGVESIVLDDKVIEKLETIQSSFAKSVLGVRQSTANVFGLVELGLKSVRQRIYECKIRFFDWLRSLPSSRLAFQALMENISDSWSSDYMADITRIEIETGIATESDIRTRRSILDSWGRNKLKSAIISKSSLSALPLPKQGWKKCRYVCDEKWSRAISMFLGGNAELGNRDSDLGLMDPDCANENGVMVECGLCGFGSPSESHVLVECEGLSDEREEKFTLDGLCLEDFFDNKRTEGLDTCMLLLKDFLDVEGLSKHDMKVRGRMLIEVREMYLSKWKKLSEDKY